MLFFAQLYVKNCNIRVQCAESGQCCIVAFQRCKEPKTRQGDYHQLCKEATLLELLQNATNTSYVESHAAFLAPAGRETRLRATNPVHGVGLLRPRGNSLGDYNANPTLPHHHASLPGPARAPHCGGAGAVVGGVCCLIAVVLLVYRDYLTRRPAPPAPSHAKARLLLAPGHPRDHRLAATKNGTGTTFYRTLAPLFKC